MMEKGPCSLAPYHAECVIGRETTYREAPGPLTRSKVLSAPRRPIRIVNARSNELFTIGLGEAWDSQLGDGVGIVW